MLSAEVELRPLRGKNPGGFLAALGVLDVVDRNLLDGEVSLRWTDDIDPFAVLSGPTDINDVIQLCTDDLKRWHTSPVLNWPESQPFADLKVSQDELRAWFDAVMDVSSPGDETDLRLLSALVVEGGIAGKGDSKPTHLHFTAGQQKFLDMVRRLRDSIGPDDFREALIGPWRYESELPVLGWDSRGERIHALSGHAPSTVKKTGVPGFEWLGFLGLRFLPLSLSRGDVITTGCDRSWKSSRFTWPLWRQPLSAQAAAALILRTDLQSLDIEQRGALGVSALVQAPIRRTDQGGYGSFGPSTAE